MYEGHRGSTRVLEGMLVLQDFGFRYGPLTGFQALLLFRV